MKKPNKMLSCLISFSLICNAFAPSVVLKSHALFYEISHDAPIVLTENKTGQYDGYDYELWKEDKENDKAKMSISDNGTFECEWNTKTQSLFLVGKIFEDALEQNDYNEITLNYDVDYNVDGSSVTIGAYGWFEEPQAEFFIIETTNNDSLEKAIEEHAIPVTTTVDIDGETYNIYKHTIIADHFAGMSSAYSVYYSIRQTDEYKNQGNASGTITVSDHFNAWEKAGLKIGNLERLFLQVDSYMSNGNAKVNKNQLTIDEKHSDTPTDDTPIQDPEELIGDIDENGAVNAADLAKLIQLFFENTTYSYRENTNADINNDGTLSIIDLILLKSMIIETL